MSKTIILTTITVTGLYIDPIGQNLSANFQAKDANGTVWYSTAAKYWVTLPSTPGPLDFQLPAGAITNLSSILTAVTIDLSARLLV